MIEILLEGKSFRPLNYLRQQLATLDLEYSTVIKDFYERREELLAEIATEMQVGEMFQAEDGTVFKIVEPEGKFVRFDRIGYVRTRRGDLGETRGSLSKKEAEASGFTLGSNYDVIKPEDV